MRELRNLEKHLLQNSGSIHDLKRCAARKLGYLGNNDNGTETDVMYEMLWWNTHIDIT